MRKGWCLKKLGELCTIQLGKTPHRKTERFWDKEKETSNVWLSIADLAHGKEISDSKEYVSNLGAKLFNTTPKGTLMLSFKLTLGRVSFAGKDLLTNEAIASLVDLKDDVSKKYLFYFFTFFDWQAATKGDEKVKGKTLNKAKLKELQIPVPPLKEQKQIVAILDQSFETFDQAKANVNKNLQNAKELFRSKLNEIFSQQSDGWQEVKLNNLIDVKHGYAFKSKYFTSEGDFVLLTPGNYYEEGGYKNRGEKQKYYIGEIPNGYVLEKGDLLVAMTEQAPGLLGSPLIVPDSNRFLHNQRLGLVQTKNTANISNEFLYFLFNTKYFRKEVFHTGTGLKVHHTSPTKIGDVSVQVTFDEKQQQDIVVQLKSLHLKTKSLEFNYLKKLNALEELKKSILQKAFAGELVN